MNDYQNLPRIVVNVLSLGPNLHNRVISPIAIQAQRALQMSRVQPFTTNSVGELFSVGPTSLLTRVNIIVATPNNHHLKIVTNRAIAVTPFWLIGFVFHSLKT